MPLINTSFSRVRAYDCDAFGLITATGLLRTIQDAAFDATTAAGYSPARYDQMNRVWLARETEIDLLRPVFYNDPVEVKTWVDDFRKVRSRRMYEIRQAETGAVVASGSTDWAFLEKDTGRPVVIPPEMTAAFFPGETPATGTSRLRFPPPPPPPRWVYHHIRRAEWRDVDAAWHVNNTVYMAYIEEIAIRELMALGWPPERMRQIGAGVITTRQHIEYRGQAVHDEEVEISTWIFDASPQGFSRYTLITRLDGELIVHAHSRYGWADLASGTVRPVPTGFLRDLTPDIKEADL
jgi:acyl-CoA thioester hydrolase